MIANVLSAGDERRLRELAYGVAKGIEPGEVLIERLGFTIEDYRLLAESNTFKEMLRQATNEWSGANNIQKRLKLKAAVNIEEGMPSMYRAMTNDKEPLAARVKVFDTMSRIAGVGNEVGGGGQGGGGPAFRLEINLNKGVGGERQIVIEGSSTSSEAETPPSPIAIAQGAGSNDELMAGMEDWED